MTPEQTRNFLVNFISYLRARTNAGKLIIISTLDLERLEEIRKREKGKATVFVAIATYEDAAPMTGVGTTPELAIANCRANVFELYEGEDDAETFADEWEISMITQRHEVQL